MAEVYKCRLSGIGGFDKLVVVKRIRPELVSDPHFVDMFLDEARIAANLSHSNIIQIYEIDQVAGIPYIAMEYVRGPTLSSMARQSQARGNSNFAVAAKVMAGICAALHYAHSATGEDGAPLGIIHRDVTPQNILVSLDGVPKLLDFGVAKAKGQIAHTTAGSIKGKFKFMAPEVFLGERSQITQQVDVFAAGVCLYQATTFHLPYQGETEIDVMRAAASGVFLKPSELVPGFCPRLEEIILGAMAPDAKDRCPDAMTLHNQLEEYAQQRGCTQATVVQHLRELFPDNPTFEPAACADIQSSDIVMTPPPLVSSTRSAVLWGPPAPTPGSGVRPAASAPQRPPPPHLRPPVSAEESDERSVDIDIADSPAARQRMPTWLLFAAAALIIAGVVAGGLVVSHRTPVVAATESVETAAAVPVAPSPSVGAAVTVMGRPVPTPKAATVDPDRFYRALASARAALDQGRFVEAANFARQALAEQIDEPMAMALLKEATEAARRIKTPARPAPVKMGGLTIATDPIAQVFLDGKLLGWSPITRRVLPEGVYQVGARHARREPAVQDVRVVGGRETVLQLQLPEKVEHPRAKATPVAAVIEVPPIADASGSARPAEPEPVVVASPPASVPVAPAPAPVVIAAVSPPPAKTTQEAPEKRAPSSPALTFECVDSSHLMRAVLPEGAEAWCQSDNGERNGKFVRIFPNGKKAEEGEYRHGKKHGRWLDFYEQGGERGRVEWRKGVQSW